MRLIARYAYESEGRCLAPLPEQLWTQEAKDLQLADCMAAIDSFFAGFPVEPFFFRGRMRPPISDACTDVPMPAPRPLYSCSAFDLARLT